MSSAVENAALDKQVEETNTSKPGDFHQDVETGPEAVDIEKIEKVYA